MSENLILPLAPEVSAPAFGWGIRSYFSHWVFEFSYQAVAHAL